MRFNCSLPEIDFKPSFRICNGILGDANLPDIFLPYRQNLRQFFVNDATITTPKSNYGLICKYYCKMMGKFSAQQQLTTVIQIPATCDPFKVLSRKLISDKT